MHKVDLTYERSSIHFTIISPFTSAYGEIYLNTTLFMQIPITESLIRAKIKKLSPTSQNLNSGPSHEIKT